MRASRLVPAIVLASGLTLLGAVPARAGDPASGSWTTRMPSDSNLIIPLDSHSAIYDPVRDRMVVFGGNGGGSMTFAMSMTDPPAWRRLDPTGSPGARSRHSAVYDPLRDRMLVIGPGSADVWSLDFAPALAWNRLATANTAPPFSMRASAIYDPVRDRLVVFGGIDSTYDQAWTLDDLAGTPTWHVLHPGGTRPPTRFEHAAVYDPARDRMVLFGGYHYELPSAAMLDDTWELSFADSAAGTWRQLAPAGTPPLGRYAHVMVLDPAHDAARVYGGIDWNTYLDDGWTLHLGTPSWEAIDRGPRPPKRADHVAIHDPVRGRVLISGGWDIDAMRRRDTWALADSGTTPWALISPLPSPDKPSVNGVLGTFFDPRRERLLALVTPESGPDAVLWALPLAGTPAWSAIGAPGALPAVVDSLGDRLVAVFGSGMLPRGRIDQVDALPLGGAIAWTPLALTDPTVPLGRSGYDLFLDRARRRVLMSGGVGEYTAGHGYAYFHDLWSLSLDSLSWHVLVDPSVSAPDGRVVFDEARDRLLCLTWTGPVWEFPLGTAGPWAQVAGWSPSMSPVGGIVDTRSDRLVGWRDTAVVTLGLAGGGDWQTLPTTGPSPRGAAVPAAYDPAQGMMVFFGGSPLDNGAYALHLDDVTAVDVSLVSAEAEPGVARLSWQIGGDLVAEVTVERRGEGGAWAAIARVAPDGTGRVEFVDRGVASGTRYGWRLVFPEGAMTVARGETWLTIPAPWTLALGIDGAMPVTGALSLRVTLPDATPARLELLDIAGRRLASRAVGALGAGPHTVPLADGDLAAGVYVVRLTQGARALTRRAVLVR